jgi:Flp pilus assembly protein TadD
MISTTVFASNIVLTQTFYSGTAVETCGQSEIEAIIQRAEELKETGEYEYARKSLLANIFSCGGNTKKADLSKLWGTLASMDYFFADYGRALKSAEQALYYDGNNIRAFYFKGKALARLDRKSEAVTYVQSNYREILSANNGSPQKFHYESKIFDMMAVTNFSLGKWDRAKHWADRAVASNPNDHKARYNLACILQNHGGKNWREYYVKSIAEFKKVDPIVFLRQKAEISWGQFQVLSLAESLEKKLGVKSGDLKTVEEAIFGYSQAGIPKAVNAYLQYFIRYVPDDINNDNVLSPEEFVKKGYGDCDDYAELIDYIFDKAKIEYEVIEYETNVGPKHKIVAFKEGNKYYYIDQSGLSEKSYPSMKELKLNLPFKPKG